MAGNFGIPGLEAALKLGEYMLFGGESGVDSGVQHKQHIPGLKTSSSTACVSRVTFLAFTNFLEYRHDAVISATAALSLSLLSGTTPKASRGRSFRRQRTK